MRKVWVVGVKVPRWNSVDGLNLTLLPGVKTRSSGNFSPADSSLSWLESDRAFDEKSVRNIKLGTPLHLPHPAVMAGVRSQFFSDAEKFGFPFNNPTAVNLTPASMVVSPEGVEWNCYVVPTGGYWANFSSLFPRRLDVLRAANSFLRSMSTEGLAEFASSSLMSYISYPDDFRPSESQKKTAVQVLTSFRDKLWDNEGLWFHWFKQTEGFPEFLARPEVQFYLKARRRKKWDSMNARSES